MPTFCAIHSSSTQLLLLRYFLLFKINRQLLLFLLLFSGKHFSYGSIILLQNSVASYVWLHRLAIEGEYRIVIVIISTYNHQLFLLGYDAHNIIMHTSHLWRDFYSDYNCCCGECICYLVNLNLNFVFWFSVLNKNDKSLYPCNTITLSTDFCNIYFVFLTYFDRFWSRRTSVEASATTTTITPPSTATVTAIPSVTHLVHILIGSRLI